MCLSQFDDVISNYIPAANSAFMTGVLLGFYRNWVEGGVGRGGWVDRETETLI